MRSTGVDITEESKHRELFKSGLKHLKDGEAEGSLRSVLSVEEGRIDPDGNEYHLGEGAVAIGAYTQATGFNSKAEGMGTTAKGNESHAEGLNTIASGRASHAEGDVTEASGYESHAEGHNTHAEGGYSHAEGVYSNAKGVASHSEGNNTEAIGGNSHAEGIGTKAEGDSSHAEGNTSVAKGSASHAEGYSTTASGNYSHAEGQETTVQEAIGAHAEGYQTVVHGEVTHEDGTITKGDYAHAEGENTQAYGRGSHAEGLGTQAKAQGSHAEGYGTIANGQWSHAAGQGTTANGMFSHAEGMQSVTENAAMASHAEGYQCVTKNNFAHAEGNVNIAEGFASHAEGGNNTAKGQFSHAEGNNNFANAFSSHAEGGNNSIADNATYAHAEGEHNTIEGGNGVHVEGCNNKANNNGSHAEGMYAEVNGLAAHAEGYECKALASYAHAGGCGTIASHESQTAIGKYNKDVDSLFSVGNGEYDEATKQPVRRDAFRVERDGGIVFLKGEKEVKLQEMFGCTSESILTCESADKHYIVLDVKLPEAIVDGGIMTEVLDSYIGKNIVICVSKKETTSEDSGNLAYPGSMALVNLKFSSFDGKWGFVPELILRNGMKNADLRSNYKLIVDDDGLLTFSIAVRNGSVNDIITTKLLANNFPEAKLVWHNGAGEEYNDDSKTRIKGITTGYVHAAKWAKEDCCLEADGHYLYDSELSIVSKGFSAGSGLAGQMNIDNLYLFPENQSKYTCYIDRGVEHSFGYPAILESARVTVSKVSSEQHITNANTYYVEQEITGIEPSGNSVYYKRVGLVQLDIADANPITWYPWQQIQTADVQHENLVITDDNVANFVVGEYLLIYPSTSIVSFETTTFQCFKGIKHIADSLYSLPNGKRVTILGNWYPMQGENNSDEYCFSTYLYGYRGGTPGYSHSSNLIRVFEDFLLFNKVWYSKGY